jgi:hypothetical protein
VVLLSSPAMIAVVDFTSFFLQEKKTRDKKANKTVA